MFNILILSVCCLILHTGKAVAQDTPSRPRLGLALSGGGSLGMAHVGVLKVMEEAGLRPDYISGVSMGSIIGSMYSLGYSADSIYRILKNIKWDYLFANKIPENKVIFPEKKNFNNSIISFPISTDKLRLPSGLINGQQIENLFSYYLWPAAGIYDFSKLPIPFMCLGTDLITCRIVDLRHGYLPDAVRASMAVPTIFTPLRIDTAYLIDGGVLRNIAVSEVKDMGSDIIIGSYVGFHMFDEKELQSATGIVKQIAFLNSVNDYAKEKEHIDILIEPDLKDYSSTVFTNVDSLVVRGYMAALPFREKFRKLADSLNSIGPVKPVENILDRKIYTFDKIEVTGNQIYTGEQILGVLDILPGEYVDKDKLYGRMELLYGRAWFEKVKYRIVPYNDSLKLVIECTEKPRAMLYGSVHYDNYLRSGILLGLSTRNILGGLSSFDLESYIGQFFRFNTNFSVFVDRNRRFNLSAGIAGNNTFLPVLTLRDETGQFMRRNFTYSLSLNKTIGLNLMTSISATVENLSYVPDFISSNSLKKLSFNYLTLGLTHQINTLDTKHFPNRGVISKLYAGTSKLFSGAETTDFGKRTYDKDFPDDFLFGRSYSFSGSMRYYFSPGSKTTFSLGWNAIMTIDSDSVRSPNNYFFAGGPEPLTSRSVRMTGFHANEIPVEKLVSFGFDTDIEIARDIHLLMRTDIAAVQEITPLRDLSLIGGYGICMGYNSIIGPVKLGLMQGLSARDRYFTGVKGYFSIGFSF